MDICFCGLPKAGKTSIIKMIFQKMCPQSTVMLESTLRMDQTEVNLSPMIKFKILDFAGTVDFNELNPPEINYLENCGALIFVMDVKSEMFSESI
jgi:Ras-related GTP-binding protein C/D